MPRLHEVSTYAMNSLKGGFLQQRTITEMQKMVSKSKCWIKSKNHAVSEVQSNFAKTDKLHEKYDYLHRQNINFYLKIFILFKREHSLEPPEYPDA